MYLYVREASDDIDTSGVVVESNKETEIVPRYYLKVTSNMIKKAHFCYIRK